MIDYLSIISKYYPVDSERYRILVAHSTDVTELALSIAKAHPELNINTEFVHEAAMLHDIGIYLTYAPGIDCHGKEAYIRHGYLGAELLRSEGLPQHAHVAERHTGAGLTPEMIARKGIDLPEGIYTPETIEEKLICYADKFFSKTHLGVAKPIEKVRMGLLKYGDEVIERFEALHQLFTTN